METELMFLAGAVVGYGCGVLVGRRSIVHEAQTLVANAIMEVRSYERSRKPS